MTLTDTRDEIDVNIIEPMHKESIILSSGIAAFSAAPSVSGGVDEI